MKLPIPKDWDGITWTCYNIYWPDSLTWKGYLYGSISQYARGATWDKNTGVIKDAQKSGLEIFNINNPLSTCQQAQNNNTLYLLGLFADFLGCSVDLSNVPDHISPQWIAETFGACLRGACIEFNADCNDCESECDDMAVQNLKCENGKLYAYMCCEWHEICNISEVLGAGVPEDFPDPDPVPPIPTCFKAGAIAEHFSEWYLPIHALVVDNITKTNSYIADRIRATYPMVAWQFVGLNTLITVSKYYPATIYDMLVSPSLDSVLQCAIYTDLEANTDVESQASWLLTYDDKNAINNQLAAYLSYDPHGISWLVNFFRSINFDYLQTAIAGYASESYDCSGCSGDSLSPQSSVTPDGWFLTQGYYGNGPQSASGDDYNVVCLANMVLPFNIWGIAVKLVSTNCTLTGYSQCPDTSTGATSAAIGPSPDYYIICDSDLYDLLNTGGVLNHAYIQTNDAKYNSMSIPSPEQPAAGLWGEPVRGPWQTDVINAEVTDVRFICNVNNLGV